MATDYKKIFRFYKELKQIVIRACPEMQHKSGIYFYTRKDSNENKNYFYIGKSVDCLKRCIDHMQGYQHIDISLQKKRGLYDKDDNPTGWHLNVLYFPENELDEKESYYIGKYMSAGWFPYNIESGGTTGKTMINERFGPKTYTEGIARGKTTLRKDLNYIIEKYLVITTKKDNVSHQKALNKFYMLLKEPEKPEEESQE